MARVLRVSSRERLNDTRLDVVRGQTLRFSAIGLWTDWMISTDADGFENGLMALAAGSRRIPDAPWFHLCGAIGSEDQAVFAIGRQATVVMPASGRLYLFANDAPGAYWNNRGAIQVTIVMARSGNT